ncbi:MAG: hypothetical protein RL308_2488, partial [Bacteroidota bacterium]
MKNFILLCLFFVALNVNAQDIIKLHNGSL